MENKFSLLYEWRYKNYQLNLILKNWFSSFESAMNFASNIKGLSLKLEEQRYTSPKKVCWEVDYPSQQEFASLLPYFSLFYRESEQILNAKNFELFEGINYIEQEYCFKEISPAKITLREFAQMQDTDIVFEPMLFNVLDKNFKKVSSL